MRFLKVKYCLALANSGACVLILFIVLSKCWLKKISRKGDTQNLSRCHFLVDHTEFIQYQVIIRLLVLQKNKSVTDRLKSNGSPGCAVLA